MIKKYQKQLARKEYMSNNYKKTLKKTTQMDKPKKQQTTKRIPPIKQIHSKNIRHNLNGKPKHQRNV